MGMGSERKSKEEKPIRDEDSKGRKRRADEGDDSSRSDRKEKRRKDRNHKHTSHSHKEKKSRDKSEHQKKDRLKKHGIQELSGDDYFLKNNEFSTWLKEERNIFFSDLSSEAARELFAEFVKEWNKLKLESRYYEGIATGLRTAHDWKIKK
ncbi:hypothetical protein MLD38_021931 [Melastoma candidum]|uniref:Uncharacterized protein n=1 Tax=Melastoma candidum TaxID=119954 RepID=A0ACB9QHQ4_9MYRT|nr:hypothetical protein MLD38_021931 [Melastoma candidum]